MRFVKITLPVFSVKPCNCIYYRKLLLFVYSSILLIESKLLLSGTFRGLFQSYSQRELANHQPFSPRAREARALRRIRYIYLKSGNPEHPCWSWEEAIRNIKQASGVLLQSSDTCLPAKESWWQDYSCMYRYVHSKACEHALFASFAAS